MGNVKNGSERVIVGGKAEFSGVLANVGQSYSGI